MNNLAKATRPISGAPRIRRAQKPELRVMPAVQPRKYRLAGPIALLFLLVLSLAYPMTLSTQMATKSYEMKTMQIEVNHLNEDNQSLRDQIALAKSPQVLEEKAREMGLVAGGSVGTISLKDAKVVSGTPAQ